MSSDKKRSKFLEYEGTATDMCVIFAVIISGHSQAKSIKLKVTVFIELILVVFTLFSPEINLSTCRSNVYLHYY